MLQAECSSSADQDQAAWVLWAPLGCGTCRTGSSPVYASGSGKWCIARTHELATVSHLHHVPSVVVATLGATSLPMPSSASSSVFTPLQSQTRSSLFLLLHRPTSPRLCPLPSQAAAWCPDGFWCPPGSRRVLCVLSARWVSPGAPVGTQALVFHCPSSPWLTCPGLQPSSGTASLYDGREREVPAPSGELLPFCTPLTTFLEKFVSGWCFLMHKISAEMSWQWGRFTLKTTFRPYLNAEKSSFSVRFSGAFLYSGKSKLVLFSALLAWGFPERIKEEGVWSQILKRTLELKSSTWSADASPWSCLKALYLFFSLCPDFPRNWRKTRTEEKLRGCNKNTVRENIMLVFTTPLGTAASCSRPCTKEEEFLWWVLSPLHLTPTLLLVLMSFDGFSLPHYSSHFPLALSDVQGMTSAAQSLFPAFVGSCLHLKPLLGY